MANNIRRITFWLGLVLALTGCSTLTKVEQPAYPDYVLLSNDKVGQSFVARFAGLDTVSLQLKPDQSGDGVIHLELKSDPQTEGVIATSDIPVSEVKESGEYPFPFSPQSDSNQNYYFFTITVVGSGSILIGAAPGDTYLDGSQYLGDTAQDKQLYFALGYDGKYALAGVIQEVIQWVTWLLISGFLFTLPGAALLDILWSDFRARHWIEKLCLASGLGLVIYPILMLWTDILGIHLGQFYAWIPPLAGTIYFIVRLIQSRQTIRIRLIPINQIKGVDFLVTLVIVLIFFIRFWVIRSLDTPMWGDSYQHTMIAQLLVDNRGLFNNWQPYAELTTFTYHFGFHSLVAAFHWITGLPVINSTLLIGQLVNGLAVLCLLPLAYRIFPSRWSELFTLIIAGLLFQMPMYYVNWGRYTQSAGLAILAVSIYISWRMMEKNTIDIKFILLCAFSVVGIALTHYRVLIFVFPFYLSYLIIYFNKRETFSTVKSVLILFLLSLVLTIPWFTRVINSYEIISITRQYLEPTKQVTDFVQQYNSIGDLLFYVPLWAWIIAPVLIGIGFWRRSKPVALICLWWFSIFIIANPQLFNLPGAGIITNFALFISLYFPFSLVIGPVTSELLIVFSLGFKSSRSIFNKAWIKSLTYLLAGGLIVIVSFLGARSRISDMLPAPHMLVTRPDVRAADWIRDNVKRSQRILVNSFFAYAGSAIVGSDGGWWIPLLTQRLTTLPPLTYTSEGANRIDYQQWTNDLIAEIQDKGLDDAQLRTKLREHGIKYIYIGQRQGRVNTDDALLDPIELLNSPYYKPVYHQDRVWIFEVLNQ